MDNSFTPTIGKDVIESLTLGMYEDPKFIFREYIQNSADQIDKAVREGLILKNEGEISIEINSTSKVICVEDNATGIKASEAESILLNIAKSNKIRGIDKGFRGIGRLGGLAYCDEMVFETTYVGDDTCTVISWDSKMLKKIINDRHTKEDATEVIRLVTKKSTRAANLEDHFFRVILKNVNNHALLDSREIMRYISQVAPVPYASKFIYRSLITENLRNRAIVLDEYRLYLNQDQLFKEYSANIYKGDNLQNKKHHDDVIKIEEFSGTSSDGKPLFWGWYGVTKKMQSINHINLFRGLRLRKSNIQIGDEYTLQRFHKEKRFQFYFIGEIHALHPDLLPNARRDYFIENETSKEFERQVENYFLSTLHKLCYTASEINSNLKKIEDFFEQKQEFDEKLSNGFSTLAESKQLEENLKAKKQEAHNAKKRLDKIKVEAQAASNLPLVNILKNIEPKIEEFDSDHSKEIVVENKPNLRARKLTHLSKHEQKFLGRIFGIINSVLDKTTAQILINKIEEELSLQSKENK